MLLFKQSKYLWTSELYIDRIGIITATLFTDCDIENIAGPSCHLGHSTKHITCVIKDEYHRICRSKEEDASRIYLFSLISEYLQHLFKPNAAVGEELTRKLE